MNAQNTVVGNSNLDGAKIIHEGSGAATKYYAQLGADAASKKLLGKTEILSSLQLSSDGEWFNSTVTYKNVDNYISLLIESSSGEKFDSGNITGYKQDGTSQTIRTSGGYENLAGTYDISEFTQITIRVQRRYSGTLTLGKVLFAI